MSLILSCSYSRSTKLGKDILLDVEMTSFIFYLFFTYNYQIISFSFFLHTLNIKKTISLSESSYTSLFKPRTPENWGQQGPISRGDLGSWGSEWMMKQQRCFSWCLFCLLPSQRNICSFITAAEEVKKVHVLFFFEDWRWRFDAECCPMVKWTRVLFT